MLTEKQRRFLVHRRLFQRLWPYAGGLCLALLLGVSLWLWVHSPLPVNPYAVLERLREQTLPACTSSLMALVLPVVMVSCLFLALAFILLTFSALGHERRLLAIIDELGVDRQEPPASPPGNA